MSGVRYSVTHYGKVLMTIYTDKRLLVVLAIEVETISTLELDGANTDTAAITIYDLCRTRSSLSAARCCFPCKASGKNWKCVSSRRKQASI